MKILFDNSVRQDAVRAEHGFVRMRGELMGKPYFYLQPHTRTRPSRDDWRQHEINCLPTIAAQIKAGKFKPFTSDELEAEAFRALKFPSPQLEDIFAGITFEYLIPPLDRSKWGLSGEQHLDKEQVIRYCEGFFLTPAPERIARFIDGMRQNPRISLTDFEERCLKRLDVFKQICKGIHRTHYPDALHLWTAEENGLDAFLTLDKKFKNVIQRQNISLHSQVLLPSELLATAGQGIEGNRRGRP